MVRATAEVRIDAAPVRLSVVPRRRRAARVVAVAFAAVFGLMFVAAAFQTQLARRQLTIDKMDRSIRDADAQYSRLRRERAELRSPGRLADEAKALGMRPATDTNFMDLTPDVIAAIQQSSGGVFDARHDATNMLDEFMKVKAVPGDAP